MAEGLKLKPGCIRRLSLANFMQYDDVSFEPGPRLNIILGPNGSGKSSIILAFALGLAGKLSSLGRASNIAEYIKTGKDVASIEVELFKEFSEETGTEIRYIVRRKWGLDGKSEWWLDDKRVGQKTIEQFSRDLNIQTGNLCQFLPQDKVYEFSRMNSKDLLCQTIAAVGETQLQKDHDKLKQLQNDMNQNADMHQARLATLSGSRQKFERVEVQAKLSLKAKSLEKKVDLLEKKKACIFYNIEENKCQEKKLILMGHQKEELSQEKELKPLKAKLGKCQAKQREYARAEDENSKIIRDCVLKAKNKSQRIEGIEEELDDQDEELENIEREAKNREKKLKDLEGEIQNLQEEFRKQQEDVSIVPNINRIENEVKELIETRVNIGDKITNVIHEAKTTNQRIKSIENELNRIGDGSRQKIVSMNSVPNGKHAIKGLEWLRMNQNKFKQKVFRPTMVEIDVHEPKLAFVLESLIPARDLVAFTAQNIDDVNLLTTQFRNNLKLLTGIIQVDPNPNLDNYKPLWHFTDDQKRKFHYLGVASDLFSAPAPIKDFLCKMHKLHQIPIFSKEAEKHLDEIVKQSGFQRFFVGHTRYSSLVSKYDRSVSTLSVIVSGKNWLQDSIDQNRIMEVKNELKKAENALEGLKKQKSQLDENFKLCTEEISEKQENITELRRKKSYHKRIEHELQSRKNEYKKILSTNGNDSERRKDVERNKKKLGVEALKVSQDLENIICRENNANIEKEIIISRIQLEQEREDRFRLELEEKEQNLAEVHQRVQAAKSRLQEVEEEREQKRRSAAEIVGEDWRVDKVSQKLAQKFSVENIPDDITQCNYQIAEAEADLEEVKGINPQIMRDYLELKKAIEDLERECADYEQNEQETKDSVNEIKTRWLEQLVSLVEKIAKRFSHYFSLLNFAGDVILNQGSNDDDFQNFGIDIMVKYRANEPMQRLDPHQQSGGERSVATALYMLALQELTVVPFRCVDEINQGMDSVNERRVFDLLSQISCRESSSQYFLLTPKLLPNLAYDENMNVLVVNNGKHMCSHENWNMGRFVEAARNLTIC